MSLTSAAAAAAAASFLEDSDIFRRRWTRAREKAKRAFDKSGVCAVLRARVLLLINLYLVPNLGF